MHILITRPQEVALPLAHHLQQQGHQVILDPLLQIRPLPLELPSLFSFEAIVTTSQQAIYCLANLTPQRDFPLWCVGIESAKVAKALGFQTIHIADGSADDLVNRLADTVSASMQPFLHLSGDIIRTDIVQALQCKGIAAQRLVIYQTQEATTFSPETQEAFQKKILNAVLLYSPRTARVFYRLSRAANIQEQFETIIAVCLSNSIKKEILALPWKNILVAKKTTTNDLLMALIMAD